MKNCIIFLMIFVFSLFIVIAQEETSGNKTENSELRGTANVPILESVYTGGSIPQDVDEKCTKFFKSIMADSTGIAYDELLKGSPLIRNEEKVRNQVVKTLQAVELYGKINGFEQAGAEYTSQSYLKVSYLSLHPFNPILWTFTFYNSPLAGWIVLNFKYTDTF